MRLSRPPRPPESPRSHFTGGTTTTQGLFSPNPSAISQGNSWRMSNAGFPLAIAPSARPPKKFRQRHGASSARDLSRTAERHSAGGERLGGGIQCALPIATPLGGPGVASPRQRGPDGVRVQQDAVAEAGGADLMAGDLAVPRQDARPLAGRHLQLDEGRTDMLGHVDHRTPVTGRPRYDDRVMTPRPPVVPPLPAVPDPEQPVGGRSEEHTSELQSHHDLVCRLLLEKKKKKIIRQRKKKKNQSKKTRK